MSRRTEHLDDDILLSMTPLDTWIGTSMVKQGRFAAEDGVEHTYDRFEHVFPDVTGAWRDVVATGCLGSPCDPDEKLIGYGFTRKSYNLQEKNYASQLFCFDLSMSADRAKQQFSWIVETFRRATSYIISHRLRTEALRIAQQKWVTANNTLVPFTAYWNADMTILYVSEKPTSKLSVSHLQRRVEPQMLYGALGKTLNHQQAMPMLEFVTNPDEIWNITDGSPNLSDAWRYQILGGQEAKDFFKYGWTGKIGNYGLRADSMPLRFSDMQQTDGNGNHALQLLLPFKNVPTTEGIKEIPNEDWVNAHIQLDFIWHRMAMQNLVADSTTLNPNMPFAARSFGGQWKFATTGLTCGLDDNGNPIAVDNTRGNKGKFIAGFKFATKEEYPEFAEAFLVLREPACVVDIPTCSDDPGYPEQDYSSANATCADEDFVLTFTPNINGATSNYELLQNSVTCNGLPLVHAAIAEASLAALVAALNADAGLSQVGTWAVAGSDITVTGRACSEMAMPWVETEA